MIEAIGKKRLFILTVVASTTVALGVLAYLVLTPILNGKEMELQNLKSQTAQILSDIDTAQKQMEAFERQKVLFEKLNKMGFLDDQNRVSARARFEALQKLSKVVSAQYEISAANIVEDQIATDSGYVTMVSPVKFNISAIDDLDVYRFIYYLNYAYPGHVKIKEFGLERKADVTPDTLKQIGSNTSSGIVTAMIEMDWTTLAKKESIPPEVLEKITSSPQQVPQ